MDRTHLRWFTGTTIIENFGSLALRVVSARPWNFNESSRELIMEDIRALAQALGASLGAAVREVLAWRRNVADSGRILARIWGEAPCMSSVLEQGGHGEL